ncbi:MAG: hypothetical protein AAF357_02980 [Verrucomicrobiota bacterium]
MSDTAKAIVSSVSEAFQTASGPAKFRYPESGAWFEWEGKDIAKNLLDLDPVDIEYDDIIEPFGGSFVPAWTTDEGLLWLVPGMIRVAFEVEPQRGDVLLREIFSELKKRISESDLIFTPAQMASLLEVHEAFYCTEDFDWNTDNHAHPLCDIMHHGVNADTKG